MSALLVSVIDDDESVRESLPDLLRELGFGVQAFSSAEEFLASKWIDLTKYLVLDIAMPQMTGPELQRELIRQGRNIPIVFITARVDSNTKRRVLANGAVAVLLKPFSQSDLLSALGAA